VKPTLPAPLMATLQLLMVVSFLLAAATFALKG
jgi:hypothetical protein